LVLYLVQQAIVGAAAAPGLAGWRGSVLPLAIVSPAKKR